jgi:hypothetical protein
MFESLPAVIGDRRKLRDEGDFDGNIISSLWLVFSISSLGWLLRIERSILRTSLSGKWFIIFTEVLFIEQAVNRQVGRK